MPINAKNNITPQHEHVDFLLVNSIEDEIYQP